MEDVDPSKKGPQEVEERNPVVESPARDTWNSRLTFFVSALGTAVGLGSLWRFPALSYKYGGGVFLIIHSLMILTIGNCIFFLEVSNGQYASRNCFNVYEKVPLMQGVGLAMLTYAYVFVISYNLVPAFTFYYFFHSFTLNLPWTKCPEEDDTIDSVDCIPPSSAGPDGIAGIICHSELVNYNRTTLCSTPDSASEYEKIKTGCDDETPQLSDLCRQHEYPSAFYWNHIVTKSYRPDDPNYGYLGSCVWPLLGCLFLSWTSVYFSLYKGVKSMGFVAYFLVPLPYVILTIMLCLTILQDGATDGVKRFFTPEIKSFLDVEVWRAATEQAFYSLGLSMGPWITFGSYSKFNSPCHIDSFLICILIILTSILCSSLVFAVLGFLAKKTGRPFEKVVEIGPGLVFIAYPESLSLLPASTFFSILFYFMLLSLGISTINGTAETVSSAIYDIWPFTRSYKKIIQLILCSSWFLFGVPITHRGGLVVYNMIDTFGAGLPLIPTCTMELITVIYLYGIGRYCEDMAFMLGFYPIRYYRYQWMFGPFIMILVYVVGVGYTDYGSSFKTWSLVMGWMIFLFVIGPIPGVMILRSVEYYRRGELKRVLQCPDDYGPAKEEDRKFRKYFVSERRIQ